MADPFADRQPGLDAPAIDAFAVTPSDTVDFTTVARRLYVGGTGDVVVVTKAGNAVTFKAVPAGVTLDIETTRVNDTDTTATDIVGLV